jgi:ribosomal protein L11 methyltransferase
LDKKWPALDIAFADPALFDLVQAALTDFHITAVQDLPSGPITPFVWRAFFTAAASRDEAAAALRRSFPTLTVTATDIEDDDWAARSQASLRRIEVGRIVVAPPWDVPENPKSQIPNPNDTLTIVIQPSMGFGTGHHATTRLCLAALQAIDVRGLRVIDVGTGSGVLAIAAARLGAAQVLGIDDDEDAIASARENLSLNPGADVTLGVLDLRRTALKPFDLVIGNLTGALLISAAATLGSLSTGRLILSGFQSHEEHDVVEAFHGWHVEQHIEEDEWGCVTMVIDPRG